MNHSPIKILPLCYLPPVAWFAAASQEATVLVEVCQHYKKQTYASRAFIRAAHGPLQLTVPIARRDGNHVPLKEKQISYATDWQDHQWKSLKAAYNKAPYFAHYADKLYPLFMSPTALLWQHNLALTQKLAQLMGLETVFQTTESYLPTVDYGQADWRDKFGDTPDGNPLSYTPVPYTQVFDGFVPGLSVIDLLFNKGPYSGEVLLKMLPAA